MTHKNCPHCYCTNVNKHGARNGKQRYQCRDCMTCWTSQSRPERLQARIWHDYAFECRTVAQLQRIHHKGRRFIKAAIADYQPPIEIDKPRPVTIIMDTTYFGSWGMLVVIDPYAKRTKGENMALYWTSIEGTERTIDYDAATDTLEAMGYQVQAAVIDGRRGVREMLERKGIPVQQCQFHQLQTITQCLTRRPKLPPNQELRAVALTLCKTTKLEFETKLDKWYENYGDWLKERDPLTKQFVHRRTRRAYFSLRRNLQYLFTYQDEALAEQSIRIPNTTNALDGRFGVWKTKLKTHRGCSRTLKTKILCSFLSEETDGRKYPD
jgi:hypothetical protein